MCVCVCRDYLNSVWQYDREGLSMAKHRLNFHQSRQERVRETISKLETWKKNTKRGGAAECAFRKFVWEQLSLWIVLNGLFPLFQLLCALSVLVGSLASHSRLASREVHFGTISPLPENAWSAVIAREARDQRIWRARRRTDKGNSKWSNDKSERAEEIWDSTKKWENAQRENTVK